jgi:hypothetical protein
MIMNGHEHEHDPGAPLQTPAAAPGDDGSGMAARRGTSRDQRTATSARAPTWSPAASLCRAIAWPLAASLVACQPAAGDPHRELPGTSTADTSSGPGTGPPADTTTAADTTGPEILDVGLHRPGYPSPNCATLLLPGPPPDVAATPRPDHDADVLALSVDPARAAAPQARYERVTADLAAIRALDPTLAEVHVGCVFPNGIAFWFFDDEDVNDALFAGDYHAWDCHNAYFHRRQELRIDDLAVAIELDGVFGEAVAGAYASLPGLDDQEPHWFPRDGWPVPTAADADCSEAAGAITLTATVLPDGALDQRDYRFERTDGSSVVYRVTPTGPPQILR